MYMSLFTGKRPAFWPPYTFEKITKVLVPVSVVGIMSGFIACASIYVFNMHFQWQMSHKAIQVISKRNRCAGQIKDIFYAFSMLKSVN